MTLRLPDRWIWDSWYVWEGEVCHAFYLCASRGLGDPERRHRHTNVGHAISRDLINWEVLPDALSPSDGDEFDSWTTWTGSTVKGDDGVWRMFYTGTRRSDGGLIQKVGVALSNDLVRWSKDKDFVLTADGTWYEKFGDSNWVDEAWRDPWVYKSEIDQKWHMLITARAKHGAVAERGVLGQAVSEDLKNWTILQPLSDPEQGFGQLEVFQYVVVDNVPLLVFCCGAGELGEPIRELYGDITATFSLPVNPSLNRLNFLDSKPFTRREIYAGRVVQKPSGQSFLLGFINEIDGHFVGEICDPIAVTATPDEGLIPRN